VKTLINGVVDSCIDVCDRGFQYGDGLFETIAYKNSQLQLWDAHMQRLRHGCDRLSLGVVDEALWLDDIKQLQLKEDAVIKLIISRGVSGRGYTYNTSNNVTRVTAVSLWPNYTRDNFQGIATTFCKTPISINPVLAGIKHLNRLDNVLARNEWHSADIAEGFMLDHNQHVIEGTMSNVFCVLGEELYTPSLQQCGVAGVMRQRVLEYAKVQGVSVNIIEISKLNFLQMDSIFITNSLIGIWPVKKIIEDGVVTEFSVGSLVIELQRVLN